MSSFVGPVPIGVIIVAILFGSAMVAMAVSRFLPTDHLNSETKSVVSVSAAVVGTMSALVVGLLISSSNASFTSTTQQVTQISADALDLDRMLRRYGPEAQDMRVLLRRYTAARLEELFPKDTDRSPDLEGVTSLAMLEELQDKILALNPSNPIQRWLQPAAEQLIDKMTMAPWQLGQANLNKTPLPLLVLVMFWFVVIFASFGLFAPRNITAIVMIFFSAAAIGSAIRMTTELQRPFEGAARVSSVPLTQALDVMGR